MERLSLSATQEYLVSKMAFSAPHLVPHPALIQILSTHLLFQAGGQNEAQWKWLLFYPCRFTPNFYNITWQVLHDEGLMIYFLSWNVGIVRWPRNCVESQWISARR